MKKSILINYNFSKSSADSRSRISGTDQRNLWCYLLIKSLKSKGHQVLFPNDYAKQKIKTVDIEIHVNSNAKRSDATWFLGLFMETPEIEPRNRSSSCIHYNVVVSSNPNLNSASNHILSPLPCWDEEAIINKSSREKNYALNTFSMVAANKKFKKPVTHKDLYKERIRIIKYFETSQYQTFKLFGPGWDVRRELLSFPRLQKISKKLKFPGNLKCYEGVCDNKNDVLMNSTFNICYENCVYPGYLSEKVFDAILVGSIPIYWGYHEIPETLKASVVDASRFQSPAELIQYCRNMSIERRLEIVKCGRSFLNSDARMYSHQKYSERLISLLEKPLSA